MRKYLFIFITILFALPLTANESVKTKLLTNDNVKNEMQFLFKRLSAGKERNVNIKLTGQLKKDINITNFKKDITADFPVFKKKSQSYKSPVYKKGNAENPWQILVFLADRDRSLDETLNQLRYRIRQGTLSYASVLVTPYVFRRDSVKVEEMYFIYTNGDKIVSEHFKTDRLTSTDELLSMLAKNLQENNKHLYTGMIVDAHGDGENMVYKHNGEEDLFSVINLLKPFEEKQVKLDLLVLDSCKMSSLFSLYYLTKTDMVDYLVASSDTMYAARSVMYYHILRFLDYQPYDAAVRSVRYRTQFLNFSPLMDTTNAGVLDVQNLREPLQKWMNEYYSLVNKMPEVKDGLKQWFTDEDTLRSLSRTVARQKKYLQENFDEIGQWNNITDCHNNDIKNSFITASDKLLQSLEKSTLIQWCYSPKVDRLFWNKIPNNDCMESISVNQYQLDRLFDLEEDVLSDYKWRNYTCRIRG